MKHESKELKAKSPLKWVTMAVVLIAIVATMTFVVAGGQTTSKLVALGSANTFVPNDVNNSLNITFSDLNYVTQPPQFQ